MGRCCRPRLCYALLCTIPQVTKALVMRMHKMGLQAAKQVCSLIKKCSSHSLAQLLELCVRNDSVGAVAADGFKLILTDTKEVLNMACHANVKVSIMPIIWVTYCDMLLYSSFLSNIYSRVFYHN